MEISRKEYWSGLPLPSPGVSSISTQGLDHDTCIGRRVLYHWAIWEAPKLVLAVLCWVAQLCPTLCDPMDYNSPGSSVHGDSPGKNTWVGCHAPCQGIFPTPGIEPRYLALQVDFLSSEPKGSPRILEWVAYPFSRGSSQPWDWTGVSCIAGRFFTSWATWEAPWRTVWMFPKKLKIELPYDLAIHFWVYIWRKL